MGFKKFLEAEERKPSFLNAMDDLGIPPKTFEKVPVTFAMGSIGKGSISNLGVYLPKDIEKRADGTYSATIKKMDDPTFTTEKKFRKRGDEFIRVPKDKKDRNRMDKDKGEIQGDEFDDLYTQFVKGAGGGSKSVDAGNSLLLR
jgi:hypothetical protein